jgi:hypothetical protein
LGTEEGESVPTNTSSPPKRLLSPKRSSKKSNERTLSTISIEDARKNWPFTRLDGALLEKLHKQQSTTTYEEAPI